MLMESELYIINDWIVKYFIYFISKMTTIARHSFSVGPYRKMNTFFFLRIPTVD